MKPLLEIKTVWEDQDMIEARVTVSDGRSVFSVDTYVGWENLKETIADLDDFKKAIHGGMYDLRWGAFGPEYANGTAHIRFHFIPDGRLCVSAKLEGDHEKFGIKQVASRAEMYLYSEPALLDNFIEELRAVSTGMRDTATLIGRV